MRGITTSFLWDVYWGLGYNTTQTGRLAGVSHKVILREMTRRGIPKRHAGISPRPKGEKNIKGFSVRDPVLAARLGLEVSV